MPVHNKLYRFAICATKESEISRYYIYIYIYIVQQRPRPAKRLFRRSIHYRCVQHVQVASSDDSMRGDRRCSLGSRKRLSKSRAAQRVLFGAEVRTAKHALNGAGAHRLVSGGGGAQLRRGGLGGRSI